MKLIFLLLVILLFVTPGAAQSDSCSLGLKGAPGLFGVRLGMMPDEVQTVFGRDLKIKIKKPGGRVFFQNFIKKPAPPSLMGVRALYLRFFDRRLYQIEIFYEDRTEQKTLADFIAALSNELKLPAEQWQPVAGKQQIDCADFTIAADKILNPRVTLTDRAGLAEFEKSQQAEQEKKKRG